VATAASHFREPDGTLVYTVRTKDVDLMNNIEKAARNVIRSTNTADQRFGRAKCSGFGHEGPPCDSCPLDETCGVFRPETRFDLARKKA
jgi:hypothetical protein